MDIPLMSIIPGRKLGTDVEVKIYQNNQHNIHIRVHRFGLYTHNAHWYPALNLFFRDGKTDFHLPTKQNPPPPTQKNHIKHHPTFSYMGVWSFMDRLFKYLIVNLRLLIYVVLQCSCKCLHQHQVCDILDTWKLSCDCPRKFWYLLVQVVHSYSDTTNCKCHINQNKWFCMILM